MAFYIKSGKRVKNIFANINGEKKTIVSMWVNNEGNPSKVFQLKKDDPYKVAPISAYKDWTYTLDETNKIINLGQYQGPQDVIVYGNYPVGSETYATRLPDNMTAVFNKVTGSIQTIKFSENIDTSNVMQLSYLFNSCSSLTSVDFGNFNTENVINMSRMFGGCTSLTSVNLKNFNTCNVTNMSDMFVGCKSLTALDLTNFDTSNVTNMTNMFNNCIVLSELELNNFNTSNVLYMAGMFAGCTALISLNLCSFITNNVTEMSNMFYGCSNLKNIYVENGKWTEPSSSTGKKNMFTNCGVSSVTYK